MSYEQGQDPSHEPTALPHDAAEYMAQLGNEVQSSAMSAGWAEKPKPRASDGPCEDTTYAYIDPDSGNGYYGVFDGAGGSANARVAAEVARQTFHSHALNNGDVVSRDRYQDMTDLFDTMSSRVDTEGDGGYTTAIVAVVDKVDGHQNMRWAAAGDSLGFLIRGGQAFPLNEEETVRQELLKANYDEATADKQGNIITNCLGDGKYTGLNQQGVVEVYSGDMILLVSDGITGDKASQRLQGGDTLQVIGNVLSDPLYEPRQKAQILTELATKNDDRSALVIAIK